MSIVCSPSQASYKSPVGRLRPTRLLNDGELAGLIAVGHEEAFEVAYRRHLPAIVRYCRAILLDEHEAEDAAQNAMATALRKLPEGSADFNLRAWLFRVAHNEAISVIRRRSADTPLDDEIVAFASSETDETVAVRDRLRRLIADMRTLPDRQRAALVMRELSGLTYGEIAVALGTSERAAMQTVFEARSALRRCEEGHALACKSVQQLMCGGDRRALRARSVRAHMRGCEGCRSFATSIRTRRRDFALLFPLGGEGLAATFLLSLRAHGHHLALRLGSGDVSAVAGTPAARRAAVGLMAAVVGAFSVPHLVSPPSPRPLRLLGHGQVATRPAHIDLTSPAARVRRAASTSRPAPAGGISGRRSAGPTRRTSAPAMPQRHLDASSTPPVTASASPPPAAPGAPANPGGSGHPAVASAPRPVEVSLGPARANASITTGSGTAASVGVDLGSAVKLAASVSAGPASPSARVTVSLGSVAASGSPGTAGNG